MTKLNGKVLGRCFAGNGAMLSFALVAVLGSAATASGMMGWEEMRLQPDGGKSNAVPRQPPSKNDSRPG
jgi:hypothetical protein